MRLGEKVKIKPTVADGGATLDGGMVEARVTYIHPLRRFYLVEWPAPRGAHLRECIFFEHRISDRARRRRGEKV